MDYWYVDLATHEFRKIWLLHLIHYLLDHILLRTMWTYLGAISPVKPSIQCCFSGV